MRDDTHIGGEAADRVPGRERLGPADVDGAMERLAVEIGLLDQIVVDNAHSADPGSREVGDHRRSQPTGSHDEDRGGSEPGLPLRPDLGQGDLARVARRRRSARPHQPCRAGYGSPDWSRRCDEA
ncbi:MAG: hypothetical protein V9F04_10800 [Dermatophilaceae bacterium]